MTRLPSYTIEIFSSAPMSATAAYEAAKAAQVAFDALSQPGYGSYVELTDNVTGIQIIGNEADARERDLVRYHGGNPDAVYP